MILGDTHVYTPRGWLEARLLKDGDPIYSWWWNYWRPNTITRVKQGTARTAFALISFDGVVPRVFRCTGDQKVKNGRKYVKASDLLAGTLLTMSDGTNLFQAEISVMEKEVHDQPQATFEFELEKNGAYCAGGLLCQ
jgi:hypothetical protein